MNLEGAPLKWVLQNRSNIPEEIPKKGFEFTPTITAFVDSSRNFMVNFKKNPHNCSAHNAPWFVFMCEWTVNFPSFYQIFCVHNALLSISMELFTGMKYKWVKPFNVFIFKYSFLFKLERIHCMQYLNLFNIFSKLLASCGHKLLFCPIAGRRTFLQGSFVSVVHFNAI